MHKLANTLQHYRCPTRSKYFAGPYARPIYCPPLRKYSTERALYLSDNSITTAKIQTGLRSFDSVSIFNAPRPEAAVPVILYIEHGSLIDVGMSRLSRPAHKLALTANATVVLAELNTSIQCPYPLPVHHVLKIYDWVMENIARNETTISNPLVCSKVGVCGELVGGSLAAMLALTESHTLRQGVSAAAIGNPVVDWTALSAPIRSKASGLANTPTSHPEIHTLHEAAPMILESLLTMRGKLFSKAEQHQDPFASPLLFFRTSSFELPLENDQQDSAKESNTGNQTLEAIRKRRAFRRYPARGSDLVLPHMRVDVGKDNVLRDPSLELIDLIRRSHDRLEVERTTSHGVLAPRTFDVVEKEGLGWWHDQDIQEIGHWFGEILRRPD